MPRELIQHVLNLPLLIACMKGKPSKDNKILSFGTDSQSSCLRPHGAHHKLVMFLADPVWSLQDFLAYFSSFAPKHNPIFYAAAVIYYTP